MNRNYKKEKEWQKEKYSRIDIYIDKDLGNKFRTKLKEDNETLTGWVRKKIEEYIKD